MAEIPLPIGIGVVLVDIANGIGAAARALPEGSRSFVGAVAMKSAKVRIDFEMASAKTERDAGLGIRTHRIFGIGTVDNATVTRDSSKGFIEFEVVAISAPEDSESAAPDPKKAAAIADARAEARKEAAAKAKAKAEAAAQAQNEARKAAEAEARARAAAIAEAKDEARKAAEAEAAKARARAAAIAEAKDEARKAAEARAAQAAGAKPAPGKDG